MSQFSPILPGTGAAPIETITGNTGGPVGPDVSGNIDLIGDTTSGVSVAGNAGTHTETISNADATTTQKGVVRLATNAEAIAGTINTNVAIIPSSLSAKLGTQTAHSLALFEGIASAMIPLGVAGNGVLPIGSVGADPVLATLTAGTNIAITNGAGSITIAANTGSLVVNYTSVTHASSPYIVAPSDYYLGADVTGGVITIELPNAPTIGRIFVIKDTVGLANAHNITVTTVGGAVLIDGAPSFVMNTAYEAISLLFNGSTYEVF